MGTPSISMAMLVYWRVDAMVVKPRQQRSIFHVRGQTLQNIIEPRVIEGYGAKESGQVRITWVLRSGLEVIAAWLGQQVCDSLGQQLEHVSWPMVAEVCPEARQLADPLGPLPPRHDQQAQWLRREQSFRIKYPRPGWKAELSVFEGHSSPAVWVFECCVSRPQGGIFMAIQYPSLRFVFFLSQDA